MRKDAQAFIVKNRNMFAFQQEQEMAKAGRGCFVILLEDMKLGKVPGAGFTFARYWGEKELVGAFAEFKSEFGVEIGDSRILTLRGYVWDYDLSKEFVVLMEGTDGDWLVFKEIY